MQVPAAILTDARSSVLGGGIERSSGKSPSSNQQRRQASAVRSVVSRGLSEMREKLSEKSETEEQFASRILREVIAPPGSAGSKGERLRAAAKALRWKFSRARDVWYGDERVSLKPKELRTIEEVSGVAYARKSVDELDHIIARADALLQGAAPDFRSALAGAIREALRAVVGPRAEG